MAEPKAAPVRKAPSQRSYDAYRNNKGKPRRPVAQIGAAELLDFGVTIAAADPDAKP